MSLKHMGSGKQGKPWVSFEVLFTMTKGWQLPALCFGFGISQACQSQKSTFLGIFCFFTTR